MPLIPLWKRLELAFMDEVRLDSDTMGFYLNPVTYLMNRFPESIQTIVLVPASSPSTDIFSEELNEPKPWVEAGQSHISTASELESELFEEIKTLDPRRRNNVEQLAPGGTIQISQFWEFMPYNDLDLCPAIPPCFVDHVIAYRDQLLCSAFSKRQRKDLLGMV